MNKTSFYKACPKTRKEFITKWGADFRFRNYAKMYGFSVVGENVIFPDGTVANKRVR